MAPQRRRTRSARLAVVAAAVVATSAPASGPGFAAGAGVATPVSPVLRAPAPAVPTAFPRLRPVPEQPRVVTAAPSRPRPWPPDGRCRRTGARLRRLPRLRPQRRGPHADLSRWLGGAELRVGHTYLPGDRWSNIEGAPGFLDAWARWRTGQDDRMFVLNVPMLERNEEHVSDARGAAAAAAGRGRRVRPPLPRPGRTAGRG